MKMDCPTPIFRGAGSSVLDERTYARFLRYPFLNQEHQGSGNASQVASTFHSLVRRVKLRRTLTTSPYAASALIPGQVGKFLLGRTKEREARRLTLENRARNDESRKE